MSDWTDAINAIEDKLNNVADIGNIHKNEPLTRNWDQYIKEHKFTTVGGRNTIRAWIIRRTGIRDIWVTNTQSYLEHEFTVFFFFAYADGITSPDTETEFQDILESVLTEFREDYRLNNVFDTREPPVVNVVPELAVFGPAGCHAGTLVIRGQIDHTF
jgi:hypothetical protein